jgi:hypothetical protein
MDKKSNNDYTMMKNEKVESKLPEWRASCIRANPDKITGTERFLDLINPSEITMNTKEYVIGSDNDDSEWKNFTPLNAFIRHATKSGDLPTYLTGMLWNEKKCWTQPLNTQFLNSAILNKSNVLVKLMGKTNVMGKLKKAQGQSDWGNQCEEPTTVSGEICYLMTSGCVLKGEQGNEWLDCEKATLKTNIK